MIGAPLVYELDNDRRRDPHRRPARDTVLCDQERIRLVMAMFVGLLASRAISALAPSLATSSAALQMAEARRRPNGVVHHSERYL